MKQGALGLRARSGWATAVVLGWSRDAPELIVRRHIILADAKMHGAVQPYHAIEKLELAEARRRLERYRESSAVLARAELEEILKVSHENGISVRAGCILLGSGRPLPDLDRILAAHTIIHAAEGVFFREALRVAGGELGLTMTGVIEKGAWDSTDLAVQRRILEIGKKAGPPWRMDEKLAALAALIASSSPDSITPAKLRVHRTGSS